MPGRGAAPHPRRAHRRRADRRQARRPRTGRRSSAASDSSFVNAATFSLLLTGKVLEGAQDRSDNWKAALGRAVGRLGEPVVRTAVREAMKILGRNFVFGRTIDEAMKRAAPERAQGLTHSFDMLGEAAKTFDDAERYADAYRGALDRIAQGSQGRLPQVAGNFRQADRAPPALRMEPAEEAVAAVLPVVRELALKASKADVHFTIDAEEADRLELQMDVFEALLADDELFANGWGGFGIAIQAYQKRAAPLCDWVVEAARAHGRKLMVRLVKGAYWDTEIKAAQVGGLPDYPVFTRKIATDVSYLACAKTLLDAERRHLPSLCDPQREHHRPGEGDRQGRPFEFQRLHGMGEALYEELARLERGSATRARRSASMRRSAATRSCSPISFDGCSRTAPTRASSTASPTSRSRLTIWSRIRSLSSRPWNPSAIRRSSSRAMCSALRAATARASTSAIRWCASRCSNG